MKRRRWLRHAVAGVTAGAVSWWPWVPARAGEAPLLLPLWPGPPPGGGGPQGLPHVSARGALSHLATPALEVYRPTRPNGAAMLVAAGGGYRRMEMDQEARPAACWLAERGVTAFVLRYRLPGEGWVAGPLAPLQDAQRALRLIRAQSTAFQLDPARLGVLGFSAGGHLMGLAATRRQPPSYPPLDAVDRHSARPDAAALIYPVITLLPPYDHTATRKVLVGEHPDAAQSHAWSVETGVTTDCPPVFLLQAADDPISNPANTALMLQACERAAVTAERHLLPAGGHGFGMGRTEGPTARWPEALARWMRGLALI